ncbi:hypothetical protein L8O87_22670, partial [Enterobacter kobei]|uniref:hypothetical protein n=1 Tax=Enterobacter kobei TaxID=208224 RepID=UPI0020064C95
FITVSVGMVLANRCHRQNMKTSIINGSEVSRLSVAIHQAQRAGRNPIAQDNQLIGSTLEVKTIFIPTSGSRWLK